MLEVSVGAKQEQPVLNSWAMKQAEGNVSAPEAQSLMGNGFQAPPKQHGSNCKKKAVDAFALVVVAASLCLLIACGRGGLNPSLSGSLTKAQEKQDSYLAYSWCINSDQPWLVE